VASLSGRKLGGHAGLRPDGAIGGDGDEALDLAGEAWQARRQFFMRRISGGRRRAQTAGAGMGIAGKQSQNLRIFGFIINPGSVCVTGNPHFWSPAGKTMRLDSTTFGRRLAQIRKHRHLTQLQLGVAVGKSKRTISNWENSLFVEIWLGDVAQCARALRCQVKDLLAPVDEPIPPYPLLWSRTRRRLTTSARSALPAIE